METVINGMRVSYIDQGSGPAVLLLHGWAAPASTYRLIIDHLSASHRVIAPDLPGHGDSAEPPEPWNVDRFVDFTEAFVQKIGLDEAVLMGHSFGGRIIIKWLNRPQRSFKAGKVILLDAAGIKPRHSMGYYLKVYRFKAAKWFFSLPGIRQMFPHAVENARKKHGSADYRQASPVMRQSMVMAVNEDLTSLLPGIRVPTLLIWGDQDTATPLSDGQLMEKRIPDAGLVVLKGGGHFAFADCWGQCSRVLDSFLG